MISRKNRALFFLAVVLSGLMPVSVRAEEKSRAEAMLERRQKIELMGFFLKDPKDAAFPGTPIAVNLYNQAVAYFQTQEYQLARQAVKECLELDDINPLAYELLGDIEYYEHRLPEAKSNYEIAYNLEPRDALREKLEKLKGEEKTEKKLSTYKEEHFIIKYQNDPNRPVEGFELRELLRKTYLNLSKEFAYYFHHQVVVLLYDEQDFKEITNLPHWVAGVYDGKVRMPINRKGFSDKDLAALTAHEVTHAFVAAMSAASAPAWMNEGLAQVMENKVRPIDTTLFKAAVKTRTFIAMDELLSSGNTTDKKNELWVGLFYQQSFHLVNYLVQRYGMFTMKKMLTEFGKGKNSDEAVQAVLQISTSRLEKEWKSTFLS